MHSKGLSKLSYVQFLLILAKKAKMSMWVGSDVLRMQVDTVLVEDPICISFKMGWLKEALIVGACLLFKPSQ